jgi:ribosome-associated protein
MLTVNQEISIPLSEFKFTYSRSPGPGGQNVNKVNTKVTLKWNVAKTSSLPDQVRERLLSKFASRISRTGELVVTSHRFRDQGRNIADSLSKLQEIVLSVATPPKSRKKTKPSKAAKRRRLNEKRKTSERKQSRGRIRLDE